MGKLGFPRKSGYSARINPADETRISNPHFTKPRFRVSHKHSLMYKFEIRDRETMSVLGAIREPSATVDDAIFGFMARILNFSGFGHEF